MSDRASDDVVGDLSRARVAAALSALDPGGVYGRSLALVAETASTNDDVRAAGERGEGRGHVVVADTQRRGRGTQGRAWSSPAGVDLYLSILERIDGAPAAAHGLTLAVGLGVSRAVDRLLDDARAASRVKWPNDVWIDERKCAGILVETSSHEGRLGPIVIGIGLGVNRREFPPELREVATSIGAVRAALGHEAPVDRSVALARLLFEVESSVARWRREGLGGIVPELSSRLALAGRRVRVDDVEGVLAGLADDGALRLVVDGVERRIVSGTLRPR